MSLQWLAHIYLSLDVDADLPAMYEEAIALGRESGDQPATISALIGKGELLRAQGDLDGSLASYGEALVMARERGNERTIGIILLNQMRALVAKGDLDRVRDMSLESVDIIERTGIKGLAVSWLDVLAGYAACREEWTQAARFHGGSDALCKEWRYQREPPDVGFLDPLMDRVREELGAEAQKAALEAGGNQTYEAMLEEGRAWLDTAQAQGPDSPQR
jgi:hypothetical protein